MTLITGKQKGAQDGDIQMFYLTISNWKTFRFPGFIILVSIAYILFSVHGFMIHLSSSIIYILFRFPGFVIKISSGNILFRSLGF